MAKVNVKRWSETYLPNRAMLLLHLGNEGYYITQRHAPPGLVYAWQELLYDKSHWVVSGELEIILKRGGTYSLKAGDRDFIPKETWYMARVIGEEPVSYLVGEKIKTEKTKRKRGRPKKL